MTRYAVLLRGINVGKAKRIAMADLRTLLDGLGFTDVRTILNSGNAVVTGPDDDPTAYASRIEAALAEHAGFEVRAVVLTAAELHAIVDAHPFADVADNGSRMMATVLGEPPDPADAHDPTAADPEHSRLVGRVLYQWCPDGVLAAPAVGWPDGRLVTTRNWNTVTKLDSLLRAPTPAAPAVPRRRGGRPGGP